MGAPSLVISLMTQIGPNAGRKFALLTPVAATEIAIAFKQLEQPDDTAYICVESV
jgi:hypothetical protein